MNFNINLTNDFLNKIIKEEIKNFEICIHHYYSKKEWDDDTDVDLSVTFLMIKLSQEVLRLREFIKTFKLEEKFIEEELEKINKEIIK